MQPKFIVLLGAPGASKGTQAEGISETLSIPQVASGDLFREALEKGTELGVLAKSYIEKENSSSTRSPSLWFRSVFPLPTVRWVRFWTAFHAPASKQRSGQV